MYSRIYQISDIISLISGCFCLIKLIILGGSRYDTPSVDLYSSFPCIKSDPTSDSNGSSRLWTRLRNFLASAVSPYPQIFHFSLFPYPLFTVLDNSHQIIPILTLFSSLYLLLAILTVPSVPPSIMPFGTPGSFPETCYIVLRQRILHTLFLYWSCSVV